MKLFQPKVVHRVHRAAEEVDPLLPDSARPAFGYRYLRREGEDLRDIGPTHPLTVRVKRL